MRSNYTESNNENISEQENEPFENMNGNEQQQISDFNEGVNTSDIAEYIGSQLPINDFSMGNASHSNTNSNSEEGNFENENLLEIITNNGSSQSSSQEDILTNSNTVSNSTLDFDDSDDLSEFDNGNEILNKFNLRNEASSSLPPIRGTMYQQAYNLLVLNDIISPGITCYCGNNDTELLHKNSSTVHNSKLNNNQENSNLMNTSSEFILNYIRNNNNDNNDGKNKNGNIFSSTPISSQINLENQKQFFKHRARPTLPLTLKPTKNRNRYTYSFFYNTSFDSYYENSPPVTVKSNWREGISNLCLNIHKNLKYEYIVKDPPRIPFTLELEWSFDFRPSNTLIETMQLEVMQNDPDSQIFDKFLALIDSITWYVHMGLTKDVINYNYSQKYDDETENDDSTNSDDHDISCDDEDHKMSNNTKEMQKTKKNQNENCKLCIIKEDDILTDRRYRYNYKKSKKENKKISFHKVDKGIHFNGIPVVEYDEQMDNSFVWQKIPENEDYYDEIYDQADNSNEQINRENNNNFNDNDNNDNNNNNNDNNNNINDNNNGEEENNSDGEIKERHKFNWVNLSKSAYQQSGFILKAVIKGEFITENFKDNNVKIINMFGHGYAASNDVLYDPKFRLFNFGCTLIPEFIVDHKLLKSIDFHISSNNDTSSENKSEDKFEWIKDNDNKREIDVIKPKDITITEIETESCQDPLTEESVLEVGNIEVSTGLDDLNLNDEKTKDYTIIIPKLNNSDDNYELLTSIRNKCYITKENSKIKCVIDEDTNNIKYFIHEEMLYSHSDYFTKIFNISDSYLYKEQQTKEITLRNVDYISFYQILFYCYYGYFPEQNLYNMYDWIALLITSSRFLFQSIFNYCELQLKKYINMETIEEINEHAIVNNALQLRRYCYLYKKYYGLEDDYDDDDYYMENDSLEKEIQIVTEKEENESKDTLCIDDQNNNKKLNSMNYYHESLLQLKQLSNKSINVLFHNKLAQYMSDKITNWFNRSLFVKQTTFQLCNFNMALLSYFTLLIYMNVIVFILLPYSIIKSYVWFIYFFIVSIKGMLFVINRDNFEGATWIQKIYNVFYYIVMELLLVICYAVCALFLFTVGNAINLLVIMTSIALSLICQSVLWPIIDSAKSFKVINSIIKGYCNGLKNEYKQIDKNEKHLPYTHLSEIQEKCEKNGNNYQDNDTYTIIKTSRIMDEDSKMTSTYEMNTIDPTSTNTTLAHSSGAQNSTVNIDTSKINVPEVVKINQIEKYNTMIPNIHNSKDHIIDIDINANIETNECKNKKSNSRSNFINRIRSAGNDVEVNIDSNSSSSSTSTTSLNKFKNNHDNQSFTLSIQDTENNKKVTIALNYFDNKSFLNNILNIWSYRIKSSIILCGRWWRIIITHPLGVYFIVFPGITKQIYLNGYEGYRFFWWHKKTVIEKPYLL